MMLINTITCLLWQQTGLTDVDLTQTEIQEAVNAANELAEQHRQSENSFFSMFNPVKIKTKLGFSQPMILAQ